MIILFPLPPLHLALCGTCAPSRPCDQIIRFISTRFFRRVSKRVCPPCKELVAFPDAAWTIYHNQFFFKNRLDWPGRSGGGAVIAFTIVIRVKQFATTSRRRRGMSEDHFEINALLINGGFLFQCGRRKYNLKGIKTKKADRVDWRKLESWMGGRPLFSRGNFLEVIFISGTNGRFALPKKGDTLKLTAACKLVAKYPALYDGQTDTRTVVELLNPEKRRKKKILMIRIFCAVNCWQD